jgi:hypothetical protein
MIGDLSSTLRGKLFVHFVPNSDQNPIDLADKWSGGAIGILHRRLLAIVRDDDVCRRLMMVPGVGPVMALTYRAKVDVSARFRKSKSLGAVFWADTIKYRSGGSTEPAAYHGAARDDAGGALRSSRHPTGTHDEMVLA